MQEKESEVTEWIEELEKRREDCDKKITELNGEISRMEWRIARLQEFQKNIEAGIIQVDHPELMVERTQLEMKNLAQLKGEKREIKIEEVTDREFCNALISYLRSYPQSGQEVLL